MKKFVGIVDVGVYEQGTGKLLAKYPKRIQGVDLVIINFVKLWYWDNIDKENKNIYVDYV